MKFYIVDDESDLVQVGNDEWTGEYAEARQFSFKEARDHCEQKNGKLNGDVSDFRAMIPVPEASEKKQPPSLEQMYFIWCFERSKYWKPNHHGYSADISDAGQYSKKESIEICKKANITGINEAMIPVSVMVEKVEDKYYLFEMDGETKQYWKARAEGYTLDKSKAYKYSLKEAKHLVEINKDSSKPVHMEPADD